MTPSAKGLIVEDNAETGDIVREMLSDHGLCCVAMSPPDNLYALVEEIRAQDVDVVILDQRLGQQSSASYRGTDAYAYLQTQMPDLPVYILTSYDRSLDVREGGLDSRHLLPKEVLLENGGRGDTGSAMLNRIVDDARERRTAKNHNEEADAETDDLRGYDYARKLAQRYWTDEPTIERVIWFPGQEGTLRMICVDRLSIPSDGELVIFSFPPDSEVPYRLEIGELTPSEWAAMRRDGRGLPSGWHIESAEEFSRHEEG